MATTALTARAEFGYAGPGGASAFNIVYFLDIGGDFDATSIDEATQIWVDAMKLLVADSWTVSGVNRWLHLTTDPPAEIFSDAVSDEGVNTSEALPPNVALCYSTSAGASRRRRGRLFMPGVPSEFVTAGGQIDPTYQTTAIGIFGDMITEIATTTGWLAAVHSRIDNATRGVASVSLRDLVDTQRRRIQRIGE